MLLVRLVRFIAYIKYCFYCYYKLWSYCSFARPRISLLIMMFFIVFKHMTINLKIAIVTSCKSEFYSDTKPWDVKLPEHLHNKVVLNALKIAYICVILKNMADETQLICGPSATLMWEKVCVLPGCVLRCLQVVWTDWLPATGDYCLLHTSSRSSASLHTNTHTRKLIQRFTLFHICSFHR